MNPTTNDATPAPVEEAEPYEINISPPPPVSVFGHELMIGPGLQLILDSNPVDPPLRSKRIICALALVADPAGFSHEQFSLLYFGHADPSRAETWNHIRSLQATLNLTDVDIHNQGDRFFLKGLSILKRVPDADIRAFLATYCE